METKVKPDLLISSCGNHPTDPSAIRHTRWEVWVPQSVLAVCERTLAGFAICLGKDHMTRIEAVIKGLWIMELRLLDGCASIIIHILGHHAVLRPTYNAHPYLTHHSAFWVAAAVRSHFLPQQTDYEESSVGRCWIRSLSPSYFHWQCSPYANNQDIYLKHCGATYQGTPCGFLWLWYILLDCHPTKCANCHGCSCFISLVISCPCSRSWRSLVSIKGASECVERGVRRKGKDTKLTTSIQ